MALIEVTDYDTAWPVLFSDLRDHVWPAVAEHALRIEHVGSTSVPGLAAKPIIDMTIVVADCSAIAPVIFGLGQLGYRHRGDLGVIGREAFHAPSGRHAHHLYLCVEGTQALRNHVAVRDLLRADEQSARAYGELKKALAQSHPDDIDAYVEAKTPMLLELLGRAGLSPAEQAEIKAINIRTTPPA